MHAWRKWLKRRWLSFDITNNTRRLNQHLRLATGLDYLDACPVRGHPGWAAAERFFNQR